MEATSTPRISGPYLDSYVGRNVMIVGKVVQLRGDQAIIDADGNVTAHLNRDAHLVAGNGAQLIGKVNPDLSIKVLSSLPLPLEVNGRSGPAVDYDLCRTVVDLTQQPSVKNLFASDGSSGGGGGNVY